MAIIYFPYIIAFGLEYLLLFANHRGLYIILWQSLCVTVFLMCVTVSFPDPHIVVCVRVREFDSVCFVLFFVRNIIWLSN